MKIKKMLEYIICPTCKENLKLLEYNGGILQGLLSCPCGHYYPLFNGVPVLIENNLLEEFLDAEELERFHIACSELKTRFSKGSNKKVGKREKTLLEKTYINWSRQWGIYTLEGTTFEDINTFSKHIPLDENELNRYKTILEIGCGNGRDIQHVKRENNLIFAIDISNSAYFANKRYERDENVFLLRCDAHCLPFKDEFFDLIYSDHVLHHIGDLETCFKEIRRVSRGDKRFIFNLYSKENNFIMTKIIEPLKKVFFKRLPLSFVHALSNVPTIALWLSIKGIYMPLHTYAKRVYRFLPLAKHMVFWFACDYNVLRHNCFDLLHAPLANYFSSSDIDNLCADSALLLQEKSLLRQTLWVCKGNFKKTPSDRAQSSYVSKA